MRLMSLVDLGANGSGHIPYDLIKDTLQVICFLFLLLLWATFGFSCKSLSSYSLQISEDEVELWAVKAVTAKLIDCKLDQMNQVVIVRCVSLSLLSSPPLYSGNQDVLSFCSSPLLTIVIILFVVAALTTCLGRINGSPSRRS